MRCPCACQMDQYGMSGEIDINTITQYLGITIVILIAVYACVDCFVCDVHKCNYRDSKTST